MSTYLRNPGTIVELDDTSITLRAEDGTQRRATRGAGFHCWLVVPGLKIGGRFTDAPEAGDVVSFVTSDSIETVVEPPVFDLLPRDDELLAMLGQDTPATGAPASVVEAVEQVPTPATKPRRVHRATSGVRGGKPKAKSAARTPRRAA
jgi:hypothetical protein